MSFSLISFDGKITTIVSPCLCRSTRPITHRSAHPWYETQELPHRPAMASSSTFPSSVLNWQPIHQLKNKNHELKPSPTCESNADNDESFGSDMIWSSWPSHFTRNPYLQFGRFVFVIWIPKRLRLTGFCYVELLQRLLQQKFLLRPQRSYFFSNNIESQAVSDSWDLRLFEFINRTEGSVIQIFKSFVVFCSSPGLEIWILVPRQQNHDQAQHVLERCNLPSLEKFAEKMIVNFNSHKVSYSNS